MSTQAQAREVPEVAVARRIERVAPALVAPLARHLRAFGWTLIAQAPRTDREPTPIRVALFGIPEHRTRPGRKYAELTFERAVAPEAEGPLTTLEDEYFRVTDEPPQDLRSAAGCMMLLGLGLVSVTVMQLVYAGFSTLARWCLLAGCILAIPFVVTRYRQSAALQDTRRTSPMSRPREALLLQAAQILGGDLPAPPPLSVVAPVSPAPEPREPSASPRADAEPPAPEPAGASRCPFEGEVSALEDRPVFGRIVQRGQPFLFIGRQWEVWLGEDRRGPPWGWIDAHGDIHRGALAPGVDPRDYRLAMTSVARVSAGRCYVGADVVGRWSRA